MTMKEFWALVDRYNADQRKQDWRAALVASTFANVMRQKKGAYKISDFMPEEPKKQQTKQEQLAAWGAWKNQFMLMGSS